MRLCAPTSFSTIHRCDRPRGGSVSTLADEVSSAGVFCVSHPIWTGIVEEILMFDTLSDRLGSVFDRLRGRGALNEGDVRSAMREVRVALLEADVALPVARDFVDQVTEKAV